MKTKIILFFLLFVIRLSAQEDRSYPAVQFKVLNSDYEFIENAKVWVDGMEIPYQSSQKSYYKKDTFNLLFNVTVICEGYDTLRYNSKDIVGYSYSRTDGFGGNLWLIRPNEKYYLTSSYGRKIPYTPHPNKLLVVLKDKPYNQSDSLLIEFENEIQKMGLQLNKTFTKVPEDPYQSWMYGSYVGLRNRVFVQKIDSTDFDAYFCDELAYLRNLDLVDYAGPLIITGFSEYNIFTYDHYIQVGDFYLKYLNSSEIDNYLKQIDDRFYFDEKTNRIVLPPSANEIVPQVMEKLKSMGFPENMMLLMIGMKSLK